MIEDRKSIIMRERERAGEINAGLFVNVVV